MKAVFCKLLMFILLLHAQVLLGVRISGSRARVLMMVTIRKVIDRTVDVDAFLLIALIQ